MKNKGFKKVAAILLAVCMLFSTPGLSMKVYGEEIDEPEILFDSMSVTWVGDGSWETPYQVSSAEHLADIPNQGMDKYYIQTENIDFGGYLNWTPVGGNSHAFTGTYDGGGYTISGLKITNGPQYAGLFYWLASGGKLMNIGLEGAQVTASTAETSYAGSLVSWNDGTVSACYTQNPSVHITKSFSYCGGLVGYNNGTVSDSYSLGGSVSTSVYTHLGGLIGENKVSATVKNCYSTTAITSSDGSRGGLIGFGGSAPTSSYYDKEAAGMEGGNGTPKTTADMKKISTFSGWDFADTWKLHEDGGYPRLQWEGGWTEGEEINAAWYVLNWNLIGGGNSDQNNVTADLNLPTEGKRSTSISWAASPEGYLDTATGEVTTPSFDEGDQDIALTATVSKGSETSRSKQFTIKIRAYSADTDIEQDFNALTWDSIKGGNSTQDSVIVNLATLPTAGASGTTISWAATPVGQSWISIPSGIVTQPTLMQGMQTVTLTAIISKHPGTSKDKAFVLTLMAPSVIWIGAGTEESPYLVSSADHLFSVRHFLKQNVYFKQTVDIDLTGMAYNENWLPIGTWADPFTGNYDGNGCKVTGLRINSPVTDGVGLFGFISGGGSVRNLHLTDADVTGGVNTGLLAGIIADGKEPHVGGGTLESCSAAGTVSGQARVGGLVGAVQQSGAVVRGCFTTATVAADPDNSAQKGTAGGLIGFVLAGLVEDSYAAGNVTGGNRTGGFVGDIQGGTVNRCYADGSVAGISPKGFVGDKPGGTVNSCYFNTGTGLSDENATGKSAVEIKRRTTFTSWNFDTIWKIGDDISTPSLWWQPWTVDEEITVAKYALTWDQIEGSNSGMDSVISDLALPAVGEKGVSITWSVPSDQSWLTADGVVTRPAFLSGDKTVVLIGKLNKTDGTEQSKAFSLTIKKLDTLNPEESVTLDHAALTWDVIKKDNASQDAVTGDLLLPGTGAYGADISWTASPGGIIDVNTGEVSLPAYNEEAVETTLTATVSKEGAAPLARSFVLTVKPAAAGNQQAVDDTFDWLTWNRIKKDNDFENNVKTDLNLIQTGLYGAAISWSNDWGARIDPATGAVTRLSRIQGDSLVTNIATIQKGGVTREKNFILTVKKVDLTDEEAVNEAADALTWEVIKGGNTAQNNVTVNLAALPTSGQEDVTIAWTVEPLGQSWVSVTSGAVTRPSTGEGEQTVTLKALVKRGPAERTLNFTLVVKASPFAKGNGTAQYPYEVSNAAELQLVGSFLGSGNSGVYFLQTSDIALSGNWTPIGDTSNAFYGKYNGGGHRISGLRVDGSYNNSGLFGYTWGPALLENLRLTGVYIRSNTSNIQSLGALCGNNRGIVKNCSAEGEVLAVYGTVQARAGVLIGYNAGTVEGSFSAGSVSISGQSSTHAGGLVGRNEGTIRECYSRASAYAGGVSGSSGGLVGNNNSGGIIQRSYSTGHVTGDGADHTEGGLVGYQAGGNTSDSFYNRETSGKSDTGKGVPKTTAEMKEQATFSAWNFTADTGVWRMMETFTYPLLQWQALIADEIILLDTAALSWEIIRNENDGENNVVTDLTLPAGGAKGASITWEANPTGYINTETGAVTRPDGADETVTLTAKVNRSGGVEQTKAFILTIKFVPLPPTLTGPAVLTLTQGYGAISTESYTVTGTAPVVVTKTSGHERITWNDSTKKLDIAMGLTAGNYPVTLKAANGVSPDATLTFTLTVMASGPESGSSGGTGSGSGGTILPAPETAPEQPVKAVSSVTATAGARGIARALIPEKTIIDTIVKAQTEARAQGKTANGIALTLNIIMPQSTTSLMASLTHNSLNSLISAGVSRFEINGSLIDISFDLEALKEIQKQSSGNVTITIEPVQNLSQEAKKLIGTRPVYNVTISHVKADGRSNITSLGKGNATLSFPYTPTSNEAVVYLFGVYVDDGGNPSPIPGSGYDVSSGSLLIPAGHFSVYGVGYTAPSARFTDIENHWGREAIDYVVGRGLLLGTSDTTFSPNTAMTRGMLVTALGRLAGVDAKEYTTNSFTDVKDGSAFRPYIEWAYEKGIVKGIGNQKFAPDRAITREEIAAIFANYAKATDYELPVLREATVYADDLSIGSVYKKAVSTMQQAGIMVGGSGNKFNPKASATRGEVSAMLHRYIK